MKADKLSNFLGRLKNTRLALGLTQDEMGKKLDVSRNYVYLLESGLHMPGPKLIAKFIQIEKDLESAAPKKSSKEPATPEPPKPTGETPIRKVPVLTWAHAGAARDFNELSSSMVQNEWTATDSKDPNSFGLRIEGDSMEPLVWEADTVVFAPNSPPRNGDFVVCRLKDSPDLLFKRFHRTGEEGHVIKLESINSNYKTLEFDNNSFQFVYPAFELKRRLRI